VLPKIGNRSHQSVFFELLQQLLFPLVIGCSDDRSQFLLGFLRVLHRAAIDGSDAPQLVQRTALPSKCGETVFGQNAALLPNGFRGLLDARAHTNMESPLARLHGALEQGFLADYIRRDFAKRIRLLTEARSQLLGALIRP
jgi:hypothetical protein